MSAVYECCVLSLRWAYSSSIAGLGIDDVEPLGSATKASVLFWRHRLCK